MENVNLFKVDKTLSNVNVGESMNISGPPEQYCHLRETEFSWHMKVFTC